jgi:hypothetical protein
LSPTYPSRTPAPEDLRNGNAGDLSGRHIFQGLQEEEVGSYQHSVEGIQIQKILSLQSVPFRQFLKIPGTVAYQGSPRVSFLLTHKGISIGPAEDRSVIVQGTGRVQQ